MNATTRPLVLLLTAACCALLLGVGLAAPSAAAPGGQERAVGPRVRATITFVKNHRNPFSSMLVWRAFRRQPDGGWTRIEQRSWRAGSGVGGKAGRDDCARNQGWLPDGRYSFVQYDDYGGSSIKGRAFYLGDHRCSAGGPRTQLFIHTETGAGNQQCADVKGDQLCRWEWPKINDYRSYGCIKMSPLDLRALVRRYHRYFDAGVRYDTARVRVRVVSPARVQG